jgi:hypothetical protein
VFFAWAAVWWNRLIHHTVRFSLQIVTPLKLSHICQQAVVHSAVIQLVGSAGKVPWVWLLQQCRFFFSLSLSLSKKAFVGWLFGILLGQCPEVDILDSTFVIGLKLLFRRPFGSCAGSCINLRRGRGLFLFCCVSIVLLNGYVGFCLLKYGLLLCLLFYCFASPLRTSRCPYCAFGFH